MRFQRGVYRVNVHRPTTARGDHDQRRARVHCLRGLGDPIGRDHLGVVARVEIEIKTGKKLNVFQATTPVLTCYPLDAP